MRTVHALINKETLRLIREKTQVSFEYLSKSTGKEISVLKEWEDSNNPVSLPTILQAKDLAYSLRVPFAGLYMPPHLIPIPALPNLHYKRTVPGGVQIDNSRLNLAIIDILREREFLIHTHEELNIPKTQFSMSMMGIGIKEWATYIRSYLKLNIEDQYRFRSSRQFYLYLRKKVEDTGVFVQCFSRVPVEEVRGIAVYYDYLPIVGLNDNDRPPAKSFSIIHELVHLMKHSSMVCNDMYDTRTNDQEEVFCNAVAGEVLVPEDELRHEMAPYSNMTISLSVVEKIADRFSVSKEVVLRRMLDVVPSFISQSQYQTINEEIQLKLKKDKEQIEEMKKAGIKPPFVSSPSRDAMDKNSHQIGSVLLSGYEEGVFSRNDIARHLGIGEKNVNDYLREVSKWNS